MSQLLLNSDVNMTISEVNFASVTISSYFDTMRQDYHGFSLLQITIQVRQLKTKNQQTQGKKLAVLATWLADAPLKCKLETIS